MSLFILYVSDIVEAVRMLRTLVVLEAHLALVTVESSCDGRRVTMQDAESLLPLLSLKT